jgi:hypothetical protein
MFTSHPNGAVSTYDPAQKNRAKIAQCPVLRSGALVGAMVVRATSPKRLDEGALPAYARIKGIAQPGYLFVSPTGPEFHLTELDSADPDAGKPAPKAPAQTTQAAPTRPRRAKSVPATDPGAAREYPVLKLLVRRISDNQVLTVEGSKVMPDPKHHRVYNPSLPPCAPSMCLVYGKKYPYNPLLQAVRTNSRKPLDDFWHAPLTAYNMPMATLCMVQLHLDYNWPVQRLADYFGVAGKLVNGRLLKAFALLPRYVTAREDEVLDTPRKTVSEWMTDLRRDLYGDLTI